MPAPQHPESLHSFYHLERPLPAEHACRGTACFAARHRDPARWQQAETGRPRAYCLGKCYCAPARADDAARPRVEVRSSQAVLLGNLVEGGARRLEVYRKRGGYQGLERALADSPEALVRQVETSELRGRGGAGFPTGRKLRAVQRHAGGDKYVVANGDEGDPGSYTDRFLMEDDPFRLIEALTLAGYAVGAQQGTIYLRREYPEALAILSAALEEARSQGFLGANILQRDFCFDIQIVSGHGSYVCGEETALLRSIEGKRPEVMPRPPFPTDAGLFGKPTLLLNIETLCNLPWIALFGGEAYHALGYGRSRGTKALSLNSLFRRPGIYEVEFGTPLRTVIEEMGGGMADGRLVGVLLAGPLGGIVPASLLDTPLDFEAMRAVGGNLGHGGLVAIDEHTSIPQLVQHVFEFAADESCGKCTPCRVGSRRLAQALRGALPEGAGHPVPENEWISIVDALANASLCGLGIGLAELGNSATRHFGKEFAACLK